MSYNTQTPYVASYVLIRRDGKLAFVLRANTGWMDGYYSLPSGKVEPDESYTVTAVRETQEEVGVTIKPNDLRFKHVMHRHEDSDWVDVYFEADHWSGQPTNKEPNKHEELAWLDPSSLPDNVIPAVRVALQQIEAGNAFSEYGWTESGIMNA